MASELQIAANQKNAQKGTGPNTPQGKAISSQNAVKHGLDARSEVMRCESRPEYELLIAEYYARFQPSIPEERCLVDDLIKAEWLGRRYMTSAAAIFERRFSQSDEVSVGGVFINQSESLCRAQRLINQTKANFTSSLKQLMALRADRAVHPEAYAYEPPPAPSPAPCNAEPTPTPAPPSPEKIDDPLVATEPLNPKLVSFPDFTQAVIETPAKPSDQNPKNEEPPPIAA